MILQQSFTRLLVALPIIMMAVPAHAAGAAFSPAMLADDGYTETFSISADLEDGGFAQVQLGVTNMGPGSGRAICRVLVAAPKAAWREQQIVSPGDWQYRQVPASRLEIGGCMAADGARPAITATTEHGTLEIVFEQPIASGPEGRYRSQGKSGSFTVTPLAVSARALVTLHTRKADAQKLFAHVYVEHDLGTVTPDVIGKQWFRFRSVDGEPVRYGFAHRRGKSDDGGGQLAAAAMPPVDFTGLKIEAPGEPGSQAIVFTSSAQTITLRPTRMIAAYEPLREMGFMGRILSSFVGAPLLSIMEVEWNEDAQKRKAILEVTTFR